MNSPTPVAVKVTLVGLVVTVLSMAVAGGIALGEQRQATREVREDVQEIRDLRNTIQELTTQQAVQQTQYDVLIKQLDRIADKLEER